MSANPNVLRPLRDDIDAIRQDFPILHQEVNGHPLVYLDNAATAQKPNQVVEVIKRYYENDNANVHRGVHSLSERATNDYEGARETIRAHLNAKSTEEIVFVRGTTEAINLVAQSYGRQNVGPGDHILITHMEHHSNIIPWQLLAEQVGATVNVIPINNDGELVLDNLDQLLTDQTKILAVGHVSNALGTINPVKTLIQAAHAKNIPVLVDGAQAMPHMRVDVQDLDCDFYAFSSHKMFGPTGVGVLYGKKSLLEAMPPYQGGGEMILSVSFEKTVYNALPYKFEAGTPNIADAIALGATIDYLNDIGLDRIAEYEHELLAYGTQALESLPNLRLIGTAQHKAAVLSFAIDNIHPHDLGTILDKQGIAVRTGHHCAMPVMKFFGVPATARASLAFYNTQQEIDRLVEGLRHAQEMFA